MDEPKEYWAKRAEHLKKTGKFEDAVFALDQIQKIVKEETQPDYWYKKGIQFFEIGDYEQAKNAIYKNLDLGSKSPDHFVLLGKIFYKLDKCEEALESLNKASEENARKHLKNTLKMDQMKNIRNFEDAVKYSNEILKEKGLDSEYWHLKGLVLFRLEKFTEASSAMEKALKLDKSNFIFQYDLAKSEFWSGNKQKAIEILTTVLSKNPSFQEKFKVDRDFDKIRQEILF